VRRLRQTFMAENTPLTWAAASLAAASRAYLDLLQQLEAGVAVRAA